MWTLTTSCSQAHGSILSVSLLRSTPFVPSKYRVLSGITDQLSVPYSSISPHHHLCLLAWRILFAVGTFLMNGEQLSAAQHPPLTAHFLHLWDLPFSQQLQGCPRGAGLQCDILAHLIQELLLLLLPRATPLSLSHGRREGGHQACCTLK